MSLLERVYCFHQETVLGRYPNATTLVDQFEVSLATAHRDIAYLRDRLLAPLAFDQKRNGFYYTEAVFDLPFAQSPKIIFLLGMLNKIAEEAGLEALPEVQQLEERLSGMLFADHQSLIQNIYCEWIEVESLEAAIFETIVESIVGSRAIILTYSSAGGHSSGRCVEPQRLCNYQGRWYLLAYCRLRTALRMFHIARIQSAVGTDEKITAIPHLNETYLHSAFGIFKGEKTYLAEILFTSTAAELVRHQHWHSNQQIEATTDGICLRLPVSDDREITMKILQYGSMAQVLSPEHLRQKVKTEIAAMAAVYRRPREEKTSALE